MLAPGQADLKVGLYETGATVDEAFVEADLQVGPTT